MKLHYYPDTDSLYIDLTESPSMHTEELRSDVMLDFGVEGQLVGIDLQHASDHVDLSTLDITQLPAQITARASVSD